MTYYPCYPIDGHTLCVGVLSSFVAMYLYMIMNEDIPKNPLYWPDWATKEYLIRVVVAFVAAELFMIYYYNKKHLGV